MRIVKVVALALVIGWSALAWPSKAWAEEAMPVSVQAALFSKIFFYNRTLTSKPKVHVSVLEGPGAKDVVRAFESSKISASVVKESDIDSFATVVYFTKASAKAREHCTRKKVLSIAGSGALAKDGEVTVGLRIKEGGRSEILVNLSRAKAEEQDFSADLLAYATVIK